jgi:hypothetical protein
MKDEKAIDWREGFSQLPLDKENKLKERSWKAWVSGIFFYFVFFLEEEDDCVKGELIVMCEEMLFVETNVYKQKSMKGSYV